MTKAAATNIVLLERVLEGLSETRDTILLLKLLKKVKRLKPTGFGFDKDSQNFGYKQCKRDVIHLLKTEEYER